jgi:hypothetical protein
MRGKRKRITQEIKPPKVHTLMHESDRGCVILVTSILDEVLGRIHECCLNVNLIGTPDLLDTFRSLTGSFGPLHSFGGKTLVGYAYGLISREQYEMLNLVRQLRNEAAHERYEFRLEDKGVAALIAKLGAYALTKIENNIKAPQSVAIPPVKRNFINCSVALLVDLQQTHADWLERLLEKRNQTMQFTGEFSTKDMPKLS